MLEDFRLAMGEDRNPASSRSVFRVWYNPILFGINVHLLVITPLIVTTFHFGAYELGRMLVASAHRGVLVTVFLVGCALTVFSRRGFIGIEGLPASRRWTYSFILLAASIAAIAWSFAFSGTAFVAIAIPMIALFGLRRLLIARWRDRDDRPDRRDDRGCCRLGIKHPTPQANPLEAGSRSQAAISAAWHWADHFHFSINLVGYPVAQRKRGIAHALCFNSTSNNVTQRLLCTPTITSVSINNALAVSFSSSASWPVISQWSL
jgi:hypothetical protein